MAGDDQGPKVVTVIWTVAVVPVAFVALRLWTRLRLSHSYGWDDTVIIVANAILIAYAGVITKAVDYGVGRHYYEITDPARLVNAYKFIYIGQPLAIVACALSKSSFALMLLRVVTKKWEIYAIWFILISINIVMLLCALFQFVQCKNPAYGWDRTIVTKCWPVEVFTWYAVFSGTWSGACDFALALWPWLILRRLQMKNREKLAVGFAMSLGVFAGVAAIIKSTYLPALSKKVDYTYAGSDVLIWGGSETGLTIVASSIGTYRPLFKKIISYATSSQDKSNYYILDKIKGKSGQSGGGTAHVHIRGTSRGLGGRKTPDPNVPYWTDTVVGDGTEKRGSDSQVDVEGGFQGDGNSDRAILGENRERIKKTTDVIISYKERQRP
ncbi:hypothetical protein PMZ80_005605 [Knufia obscura]|uniref:Rhodopsin domain-containing protein n=2 Tax=Knufia TaxID=430999 RepID=A0AAN8EPL0_9EURO|nr:hypothetical protein PMZ80_005605 [Knufia obscura]KAK5949363.1 hypothetical protein OHC33_009535 [Knufia fluminis]